MKQLDFAKFVAIHWTLLYSPIFKFVVPYWSYCTVYSRLVIFAQQARLYNKKTLSVNMIGKLNSILKKKNDLKTVKRDTIAKNVPKKTHCCVGYFYVGCSKSATSFVNVLEMYFHDFFT
jgi:hypothetical protein